MPNTVEIFVINTDGIRFCLTNSQQAIASGKALGSTRWKTENDVSDSDIVLIYLKRGGRYSEYSLLQKCSDSALSGRIIEDIRQKLTDQTLN